MEDLDMEYYERGFEKDRPLIGIDLGVLWVFISLALFIFGTTYFLEKDHTHGKQHSTIRSDSGNQTTDSTGHNVVR